jgi:hypothetical protein
MKAPDQQLIALTFADGTLGVMSFVTIEYNNDDVPRFVREATDENINAEIAKASARGAASRAKNCQPIASIATHSVIMAVRSNMTWSTRGRFIAI